MRVVLQRVTQARVVIDNQDVGRVGQGLLLLVGIHKDDTPEAIDCLAAKCADIRVFADHQGKMNLSLREAGGGALVVSQFTLLGDCRRGRRPSYTDAAPPEKGKELYERFVEQLRTHIPHVQTGVFGAMMHVELVNDGPVTLVMEK
jgi:D-tyrosyl-tRNA(Tyr) deacylase